MGETNMTEKKIVKTESEGAHELAAQAAQAGMADMAQAAETLDAARDAAGVAVMAGAAGVEDLTRAEDAAIVAQRVSQLSTRFC
jgi:hypothetical protein